MYRNIELQLQMMCQGIGFAKLFSVLFCTSFFTIDDMEVNINSCCLKTTKHKEGLSCIDTRGESWCYC